MFSALADWTRLVGAAWRLSRYDALIPREYAHLLPPPMRALGALSRVGAGRGKGGRIGERLAAAFEGMGPAYVKLGQFMATRPDIIGFEMAGDLARLQDKMPPFPRETAIKELEASFNTPLDDLLADFSDPVAAASIAQVHKARTKDGKTVAVKILRPEIERKTTTEFRAFARAAHAIETISHAARRMEPVKFVDTLKDAAALELDLRMEAGAASAMGEALKPEKQVRAPDVVWPLTTRRVLTLEWIDGVSVGDLNALAAQGVDRKKLGVKILQLFLTHALHDGFFHADMHQGNMMIDKEGDLVLIDFGIMGRLDDRARNTFAQIIHGFITRDYQHTAQVHFDAGYISAEHSVDAFAQALRAVGEPLYGQNAGGVDMSRVLQQLFDVTDLFDMHLRPELVLLQRTMVAVEGVARMLDPQINMWDAATPIVRSYIENEVGPRRQLAKIRRAAFKAADIAPQLPEMVERAAQNLEAIADAAPQVQTAKLEARFAREQAKTRMMILLLASTVFVLAAASFLR